MEQTKKPKLKINNKWKEHLN